MLGFLDKKDHNTKKERLIWLDCAKAAGIIIVVLNHLDLHILFVTYFGGMFYMPLFFLTAGYTWKTNDSGFMTFIKHKAIRLLLPYFICNLFLFGFFSIRGQVFEKTAFAGIFFSRSMLMRETSTWNYTLMPYLNAPTWFLTCLFTMLCIYHIIDRVADNSPKKRYILIGIFMIAGMAMHYLAPFLWPWSLENALFFMGILEVGRCLKSGMMEWMEKNQWIYGNIFLIFVILSYINGSTNISISSYGHSMILCLITGVMGSILCIKACKIFCNTVKKAALPVAFIGKHSMEILCWHLFVIEIVKAVFFTIQL